MNDWGRERLGEGDVGGVFTPSAEHTRHLEHAKVRSKTLRNDGGRRTG